MKRGILRIFAVAVTAAVSLAGSYKSADAKADTKLDRDRLELQQRINAAQGEQTQKSKPKLGERLVQWYNWNNWDNWSNWGNW